MGALEIAIMAAKTLPDLLALLARIREIRAATIDTNPEVWAGVQTNWNDAFEGWDAKAHPK